MWEQTVPIFERIERPDLLRDALDKLGDTQAELMDWDVAQASYSRALALAQAAGDQQDTFDQFNKLAWVLESRGDRDGAVLYYRRALHLGFGLGNQEQVGQTELALARLLIDDTVHLNRSLQLLEAASQLLPDDTEAQRLLSRAKTRQERLAHAG